MPTSVSSGSEFLTAVYESDGPESHARTIAERICIDQTIEGEHDLLPASMKGWILGHLERLQSISGGRYRATIRYTGSLLGSDCSDVLNVLFGTSSLRKDVVLRSFTMTNGLLSSWRGPRLGISGLRQAVRIHDRPLLCAVLKPLGRTPQELAELAGQFVQGGVDLIKDDQSLVDQPWCPFEDRVARCAEAIAQASAQRRRPCLYFPHISGALDVMRWRAAQAKAFGATGLLVAPGLTGFDALRTLSTDDTIALPIASHPSCLSAAMPQSGGGLAPAVVYGQLPRLAGADVTIYPAFGSDYPIAQSDCVSVTEHCLQAWGTLRAMLPALGGRIGPERARELQSVLGREIVLVTGSHVQRHPAGVVAATQAMIRVLEETRDRSSGGGAFTTS